MKRIQIFSTARILFAAILIFLVASCSQDVSEQEYLARAQEYLAKSDPRAALVELKNALQENPTNSASRLQLAQLYFDLGDIPSAEKEVLRVRDSGTEVDINAVAPLLAQVWMRLGKGQQVLEMAPEGLDAEPLAIVLAAQALAYLANRDIDNATQKLAFAEELAPDSIDVANVKAQILYFQQDFTGADKLLGEIHQKDPDNARAWSLHGDLKSTLGELKLADEYYSKAIQLDESALGYQMKQVFLRIRLKQYDLAQKGVDVLLEYAPQSIQINYAQGQILFFQGKFKEAISFLLVAEPEKFRYPELLMYLAMSHYQLGDMEKAYLYVQDFYALETKNPEANKLLSTLLVDNGKYIKAEQLITSVLAQWPDDVQALNILARSLMAQARVDEAIDILAQIVEVDPESAAAKVRLGAGYLQGGRSDEAVEVIQGAVDQNMDGGFAETMLVLTYLKSESYEKALEAAQSYQQREPADPAPMLLIGRIYLHMNDTEAARKAFLDAVELEPGNPAANHNLAAMAIRQHDSDAARGYYKAVLKAHPHFLSTLLSMALLEGADKNYPQMTALLEEAIEAHPEAVQPRIALGRYQLHAGRADKVLSVFTGLPDEGKNQPEVLRLIGEAQLAEGLYADARYSYETLLNIAEAQAIPEDYRQLGLAYKGLGDTQKMREQMDKAAAAPPNSLSAHLARAASAFSRADSAAFERELAAIEKIDADNFQLKQLRAAYARVNGDQQKAVELYEEIYEASPNTVSMLNLQKQYQIAGDEAAARTLLQGWVDDHTDDNSARVVLAGTYLESGDNKKLIKEYSAVIEKDANNVVALNNLAWSLLEEKPKLALQYAEKAASLAPKSSEVIDTLALAQSANGRNAEAAQTIQSALGMAPGNPNYLYHSALIAIAGGHSDEALAILKPMLASQDKFQLRGDAEKLMDSLSGGN